MALELSIAAIMISLLSFACTGVTVYYLRRAKRANQRTAEVYRPLAARSR